MSSRSKGRTPTPRMITGETTRRRIEGNGKQYGAPITLRTYVVLGSKRTWEVTNMLKLPLWCWLEL